VFSAATWSSITPSIDLLWNFVGGLFLFAVSTWGLGFLGLCQLGKQFHVYTRCIKVDKNSNKSDKSDTPDLRKQSSYLIFTTFAFLALLFSLIYSVLFTNDVFVGNIAPIVLLSVTCGIFIHGLTLRTILFATVVHGLVFSGTFTFAPTLAGAFGEVLMFVSAVFSFMSLLIVFVSCGGRYKTRIIAGAIAAISLFFAIHTVAFYLPTVRESRISGAAEHDE
jgi:hypothetical protein